MDRFAPELLARLDEVGEVEIETRSASGQLHRTIIWIVVVGEEPYVRSVRGVAGRWYREIVAEPMAALVVDGTRHLVRAEAAADPASIEAVSAALRAKYGRRARASTAAMLVPRTLRTTLRLAPRPDEGRSAR
ncbi:MAG TPA: DUF2255 family protein [Candidatus Limnocylindria bacterium]|nr:DUF2255 family protein [Candidatus Limnocylindria bacterium]